MIQEQFGKRIKELRIAKSLSQNDLADIICIDRAQISKIEKGKVNVTLETIKKFSDAFEVPIQELMSVDVEVKAHPFVKWAGGKTQILNKLLEHLPKEYNNYYEPFVGGGALLFYLSPKNAFINDENEELICAYKCFKDSSCFLDLKKELRNHEKHNNEEYYYSVRDQDLNENYISNPVFYRAARMIYLNKACYNGLYRVNSHGHFNVPFCKKDVVNTFEEDNFNAIRKYFLNNNVQITCCDFEKAVEGAAPGDFVYFDPPYDVYPDKLGFVDYGKNGFGKEEQIRLRDCFRALTEKGVYVMLSNHNTEFINELYKEFNIYVIDAKRMINSKADGRGKVQEVIITNY